MNEKIAKIINEIPMPFRRGYQRDTPLPTRDYNSPIVQDALNTNLEIMEQKMASIMSLMEEAEDMLEKKVEQLKGAE